MKLKLHELLFWLADLRQFEAAKPASSHPVDAKLPSQFRASGLWLGLKQQACSFATPISR